VDRGGAWVHADVHTALGVGLYRYGFCAVEARVCAELLRPGDVFVDGGANIGLFALRGATVSDRWGVSWHASRPPAQWICSKRTLGLMAS
jgi:hypothetical protein